MMSYSRILLLIGFFHVGDTIFCGTRVLPAERDQFSYLVEVVHSGYNDTGYCAGAIIDASHILTAAHCFSEPIDGDTLVIAGVVNLNSILRMERSVSKIHVHEEYNYYYQVSSTRWSRLIQNLFPCVKNKLTEGCKVENDIAVLTLSEALPLGKYIKPIKLPDTDFLPHCEFSNYAGWGQTVPDGPISMMLFSTSMMILPPEHCHAMHAMHSSNQFCAMDPFEQTCALEGDSGAPLVFKNTIYGLSSTGRRDPAYPNIFTKIFNYLDFIQKALED